MCMTVLTSAGVFEAAGNCVLLVERATKGAARARSYAHEGLTMLLLCCCLQVFVRVFTSAGEIKHSASKQAYVWQSQGCDSWWLQPVGQVQQKANSTKFSPANGPGCPTMR